MKGFGILALVVGTAIAAIAFFLPVTVATEVPFGAYSLTRTDNVVNIGKLQVQMLVFQSGAAIFLAGAVFTAIGSLIEQLAVIRVPVPANADIPDSTPKAEAPPSVPVIEETEEERAERRLLERQQQAKEDRTMYLVVAGVVLVFIVLFALANLNPSPKFGTPGAAAPDAATENVAPDTMITNLD